MLTGQSHREICSVMVEIVPYEFIWILLTSIEFISIWTLRVDRSCTLRWWHNGRNSVSNHQPHDCLLNRLFGCISKKTSKLRATGLCEGNSPGTGEFSTQMPSYAEDVSIWWRHHDKWESPAHYIWFDFDDIPIKTCVVVITVLVVLVVNVDVRLSGYLPTRAVAAYPGYISFSSGNEVDNFVCMQWVLRWERWVRQYL